MRPTTLLALALLAVAAACAPSGPLAPDHGRVGSRPVPAGARRPSVPIDSLIVVLPIEPIVEIPEPVEW